eukprot:SAG31_NODE_975_length_10623_cov_7.244964_11_plen_63_part_00
MSGMEKLSKRARPDLPERIDAILQKVKPQPKGAPKKLRGAEAAKAAEEKRAAARREYMAEQS